MKGIAGKDIPYTFLMIYGDCSPEEMDLAEDDTRSWILPAWYFHAQGLTTRNIFMVPKLEDTS